MSNIKLYSAHRPTLLGDSTWTDMFDQFFGSPHTSSAAKPATRGFPVSDVFHDDDGNAIIEMALAGYSKDSLSVEAKGKEITISSSDQEPERESLSQVPPASHRRVARRKFKKTFHVVDDMVDLTKATASYEDGLLRVSVPLKDEAKTTSIDIS